MTSAATVAGNTVTVNTTSWRGTVKDQQRYQADYQKNYAVVGTSDSPRINVGKSQRVAITQQVWSGRCWKTNT